MLMVVNICIQFIQHANIFGILVAFFLIDMYNIISMNIYNFYLNTKIIEKCIDDNLIRILQKY